LTEKDFHLSRFAALSAAPRVYPHLLRHSIATILLDSGQVPIDQVQKFLGHLHLSTTQIYAETSMRALGENYVRALTRGSASP
jgi:integrase/recombinase XerD